MTFSEPFRDIPTSESDRLNENIISLNSFSKVWTGCRNIRNIPLLPTKHSETVSLFFFFVTGRTFVWIRRYKMIRKKLMSSLIEEVKWCHGCRWRTFYCSAFDPPIASTDMCHHLKDGATPFAPMLTNHMLNNLTNCSHWMFSFLDASVNVQNPFWSRSCHI